MEIIITQPILRGWKPKRPAPFTFSYDVAEYEAVPTPLSFPVLVPKRGLQDLLRLIREGKSSSWSWFDLGRKAEVLAVQQPTDLLVLQHLKQRWKEMGVIPYPHQIETARRVIWEMNGRAILADEVGLGKTIEAGMILKEYLLRRLVQRALILVPASLCWQWESELREKFAIPVWPVRHELDWERPGCLLASLDTAKKPPHAQRIQGQSYDLLIVDEAHKLKNKKTKNWQLVNGITKKYFLMLTATPVQNDLRELYTLIDLLYPGLLGTFRSFQARYVRNKREVRHPEELRSLLGKVMIRHHREKVVAQIPSRCFHAVPVELSPQEWELYQEVTNFVRREYPRFLVGGNSSLPLITLQREVCSSPWAVAQTLANLSQKGRGGIYPSLERLYHLSLQIPESSKAKVVEQLLKDSQEQWLIFTEFRATQAYLCRRLQEKGFTVLAFDGSLSPSKKEWIRWLFQKKGQVLVSTEAGGEGLNFQFCHNVINFDLPWNPMRLEQRIGRVHRLGQTREVHIYNLATQGTIEEHILHLLFEKLRLFQTLVGDVVSLFGDWLDEKSWEGRIMDLFVQASSPEEFSHRLDELGREIEEKRSHQKEEPWWMLI